MEKTDRLIDWNEDERTDRDGNGIDDAIQPGVPESTASKTDLTRRLENDPLADPTLTAGDLDENLEATQFSGDGSAVSGMPGTGGDVVDEIGRAMGVTYQDGEELKAGEKERERDRHRWELDPASSEDYKDRLEEDR